VAAAGLLVIGAMAATATDMSDPIGGLKPLLVSWYFIPYLIIVACATIANNFLNTYTSGLTLLTLGLRVKRWKTILIDSVLATGFAVYAVFFHDITNTFIEFISLMIIWIAPWCAIFLVNAWLHRGDFDGGELLRSSDGRYLVHPRLQPPCAYCLGIRKCRGVPADKLTEMAKPAGDRCPGRCRRQRPGGAPCGRRRLLRAPAARPALTGCNARPSGAVVRADRFHATNLALQGDQRARKRRRGVAGVPSDPQRP
jgi:Permease for cytosine/purines, uracil, thiamine, allantoin